MDKYDLYKSYKQTIDDEIEMMMTRKMIDFNSIEVIGKLMKLSHKLDKCLNEWDTERNDDIDISMDYMNPAQMEYMNSGKDYEYKEYINWKKKYNESHMTEDKKQMLEHLKNLISHYEDTFKEMQGNGFCMEESALIKPFLQSAFRMAN